jgi:adenine-specific DNA-methyltransferase
MPTLHWLTREQDLKAAANAEYRLLVEEEKYSYGDPDTGNLIVQGDNLEALKALLPFYAGQVKCIYIDPPYNTGSAFEHYDDNLEHTQWLSLIYPRLQLLKNFLSENGCIWISIDDDEGHYLKVICDEIFGRDNFVNTVLWQKIHSLKNDAKYFSENHDFILVYAKSIDKISFKLLPRTDAMNKRYQNLDDDLRGSWQSGDLVANEERTNGYYDVVSPKTGKVFNVPKGKHWVYSQENLEQLIADNRVYFGKDGNAFPRKKRFLTEVMDGRKCDTWWLSSEVGHNQEAKIEIKELFSDSPFSTPKPERLIQRILTLATNPGDYVLDSFLGSGTTAAVAHKMGRRYIGVEMGEQAKTHCAARLKKVIDGEQGGISQAINWKSGGGFRFFKLGEAVFDNERRIKPDISFENLATHIWFTETKTPLNRHKLPQNKRKSAFLGVHDGTAYALLYNGILGDKSVNGGNVLTHTTLNYIKHEIETCEKKNGGEFEYNQMVVYGESTRLIHVSLEFNNIVFKQTPYDIKVW